MRAASWVWEFGTVVQSCLDAEAEDSKEKRVGRKSRRRCAPIQ